MPTRTVVTAFTVPVAVTVVTMSPFTTFSVLNFGLASLVPEENDCCNACGDDKNDRANNDYLLHLIPIAFSRFAWATLSA